MRLRRKTTKTNIGPLVWDVPTRIFHWCLLIGVAYAWFAVEILEDMQQHFYAGYSILTLLLFRLVWGFIGTRFARFKSFLYSPKTIFSYAKTLTTDSSKNSATKSYFGHNPLGGLSALAMLAVLMFQASSGLFSSDDYYYGPLAGLVDSSWVAQLTELHHLNSDIILSLIGLHVISIFLYRWLKKEHLVGAMFHGRKFHGRKFHGRKFHGEKLHDQNLQENSLDDQAQFDSEQGIKSSKLLLAALVLALSITAVYLIANSFTDTLPSAEDYYSY